MRALVLIAVAGCSPAPYVAGTFGRDKEHPGCLDVQVCATRRPEATGPVVVYKFGNRCEHSVRVDLSSVRVVAGDAAGRTETAAAYDPHAEIRVLSLDARAWGSEWIEYRSSAPLDVTWLDVDIGAIEIDSVHRRNSVHLAVAR